MTYLKVNGGDTYIEYNPDTKQSVVLVKSELEAQKAALEERIATADPNRPTTDEAWITWAKANYIGVDHSAEIAELEKVTFQLSSIEAL